MKRFWDKVTKTDSCWIWTKSKKQGKYCYGEIKVNGKLYLAHRFAYKLTHGFIPDNCVIMHSCDNPLCVNPSHLIAGTQTMNMHDMIKKGRDRKKIKLSDFSVNLIRLMHESGQWSKRSIAKEFDVTHPHICYITNNKSRISKT